VTEVGLGLDSHDQAGVDSGNTGDRDRGLSIHFEMKKDGGKTRHLTEHGQADLGKAGCSGSRWVTRQRARGWRWDDQEGPGPGIREGGGGGSGW
jgi:hypothetical protein